MAQGGKNDLFLGNFGPDAVFIQKGLPVISDIVGYVAGLCTGRLLCRNFRDSRGNSQAEGSCHSLLHLIIVGDFMGIPVKADLSVFEASASRIGNPVCLRLSRQVVQCFFICDHIDIFTAVDIFQLGAVFPMDTGQRIVCAFNGFKIWEIFDSFQIPDISPQQVHTANYFSFCQRQLSAAVLVGRKRHKVPESRIREMSFIHRNVRFLPGQAEFRPLDTLGALHDIMDFIGVRIESDLPVIKIAAGDLRDFYRIRVSGKFCQCCFICDCIIIVRAVDNTATLIAAAQRGQPVSAANQNFKIIQVARIQLCKKISLTSELYQFRIIVQFQFCQSVVIAIQQLKKRALGQVQLCQIVILAATQ